MKRAWGHLTFFLVKGRTVRFSFLGRRALFFEPQIFFSYLFYEIEFLYRKIRTFLEYMFWCFCHEILHFCIFLSCQKRDIRCICSILHCNRKITLETTYYMLKKKKPQQLHSYQNRSKASEFWTLSGPGVKGKTHIDRETDFNTTLEYFQSECLSIHFSSIMPGFQGCCSLFSNSSLIITFFFLHPFS